MNAAIPPTLTPSIPAFTILRDKMGRAGADARGAGCGFRESFQFVAPFFLH